VGKDSDTSSSKAARWAAPLGLAGLSVNNLGKHPNVTFHL
jgi:hypothetical protein